MGGTDGLSCNRFLGPQLLTGVLLHEILADPDMYNPDVLGYGVRVANFITNICAAILITFGQQKDGLLLTLLQTFVLLASAVISLPRGQLGFYDGLFTLVVAHSPILWNAIYLGLHSRYNSPKDKAPGDKANYFTPILSFVVFLLWVSLDLQLWFYSQKNKVPDANCDSLSFKDYVIWVAVPLITPGATWLSVDPISFTTAFAVFGLLFYLHNLRYTQFARVNNNNLPIIPHFLVNNDRPWPFLLPLISQYWAWSCQLVIWSVEPGYSFTYGQTASVLAAVVSVYPVYQLIREANKIDYLRTVASDCVFLAFGHSRAARINGKYLRNSLIIPPRTALQEEVHRLDSPSDARPPDPGPVIGTLPAGNDTQATPNPVSDSNGMPQLHASGREAEDGTRASIPPRASLEAPTSAPVGSVIESPKSELSSSVSKCIILNAAYRKGTLTDGSGEKPDDRTGSPGPPGSGPSEPSSETNTLRATPSRPIPQRRPTHRTTSVGP
ncbi:hypothetical protein B0H13DRAFT_2459657 [Mycena leptocephala]|nr:hypothetical protein B0H13DRAFT_2459657 [Mycena leptocephala]